MSSQHRPHPWDDRTTQPDGGAEQPRIRKIRRGALEIGMTLPAHILDDIGRVLIRSGQIVDAKLLAHLDKVSGGSQFFHVGPDWPVTEHELVRPSPAPAGSASDPGKVIEALCRQREREGTNNLRRHERYRWRITLNLDIKQPADMGGWRTAEVTTRDISVSGFAFVFTQYFHPGTLVRAQFTSLPAKPTLTGVVRSCIAIGGLQHRVGVEFQTNCPAQTEEEAA